MSFQIKKMIWAIEAFWKNFAPPNKIGWECISLQSNDNNIWSIINISFRSTWENDWIKLHRIYIGFPESVVDGPRNDGGVVWWIALMTPWGNIVTQWNLLLLLRGKTYGMCVLKNITGHNIPDVFLKNIYIYRENIC